MLQMVTIRFLDINHICAPKISTWHILSLLGTLSSIGGSGGNNVFGVIRSIAPFRLTGSTKGLMIDSK